MLFRRIAQADYVTWVALGAASTLWLTTVSRVQLSTLVLAAPFTLLGAGFWVGLTLATVAFIMGQYHQRVIAVGVLGVYFIATLPLVAPYPIMHDSLANVLLFPSAMGSQQAYGMSYGGFGAMMAWVERGVMADPWSIARLFPIAMLIAYLLTIGLFITTWRGKMLSSPLAELTFAFFIIVFQGPFFLRINAAPQTVGFLAFLVTISVLPLAYRSVAMKFVALIGMAAMIVLHPITPLLALPGLFVAASSAIETRGIRLLRPLQLMIVFLVAYISWILYRADWLLSRALGIVLSALTEDKILPIVQSRAIPSIGSYQLLNRSFLIVLLLILAVSYICLWRTRLWMYVTLWGLALAPGFLLLFSFPDFFDRVLLFAIVPCALLFAEASGRLWERHPRLRIPAGALLLSLTLLAATVTHFWIGVVDRVTYDEVDAARYLVSLNQPLTVYTNGFNLPLNAQLSFVPASRGVIVMEQVQRADAVVISDQMRNAVLLSGRASMSADDLVLALKPEYIETYASGNVRIFLKRPLARQIGGVSDH
jgi:hypothetical protein